MLPKKEGVDEGLGRVNHFWIIFKKLLGKEPKKAVLLPKKAKTG